MKTFTVGTDEYQWSIQSKKPIFGKDRYCLTVGVRRMRDGKTWTGAADISHEPSELDAQLPEWLELYTFGRFPADSIPENFEIMRAESQRAPSVHKCVRIALRADGETSSAVAGIGQTDNRG